MAPVDSLGSRATSCRRLRLADLDEVQLGRQLRRQVHDDGSPVRVVASMAAGIVADVLTTTRSPSSQPLRQVAGDVVARCLLADRDQHAHGVARPSVNSGGSVASSSGGSTKRSSVTALTASPPTLGSVRWSASPRQGQDARARCPRAAAGRRCPRRGRRPGASGCACRPGRWSAPEGRGARRRGPARGGRGPPWSRRSRPSPRRPRRTRRT